MAFAFDNFNRADNTDLGANWDPVTSDSTTTGLKIVSKAVVSNTGASDSSELWNATTFAVDQFCEVTLDAQGASGVGLGMGPIVRHVGPATLTCYRLCGNGSGYELGRMNAGVFTSLISSSGTTFSAGDTIRLEVSGSGATVTLRIYKNGVQVGSDTSDSSAGRITASSKCGIQYSSTDASTTVRGWAAGDLNTVALSSATPRLFNMTDDGAGSGTQTGGNQTGTSATFRPPDNSLLVAYISCNQGTAGGTPTFNTPTNTGTGVGTWTLKKTQTNASGGAVSIWEAQVGTGSAITVSLSVTNVGASSAGVKSNSWVQVWTGADSDQSTAATAGSTSTTANYSPTITTTRAGSEVTGVAMDWSGNGTPTSTDVIDPWFISGPTGDGALVWKAANSGAPGSVAVNFNQATTPIWTTALLEILAPAAGPAINTQPSDTTAYENTAASFTVAATTSGGSLSYQWQDNRSGSFANVIDGTGGTSASYTTPPLTQAASGRLYRCVVTDSNGSTTSKSAKVSVVWLIGNPVVRRSKPVAASLFEFDWNGPDLAVEKWFDRDMPAATGGGGGGGVALTGAAIGRSIAVGAMTVAYAIAGVGIGSSTATGAARTSVAASGVAIARASATGNAQQTRNASGGALSRSTAIGAMSVTNAVSGVAIAKATPAGAMTTALPLSGVAIAQMVTTGDLQPAASAGAVSGGAVISSTAVGAASATLATAGGALARSTSVGDVRVTLSASGISVARSVSTGDVLNSAAASGVGLARSVGVGEMSIAYALSGVAVGRCCGTGRLLAGGTPVWPDPADVRAGVTYGPTGFDYTGTLVVTTGGGGSYVRRR